MKKLTLHLGAILLASAAIIATPALAKDKKEAAAPAPAPPKLTKAVQLALIEAQKLQAAGDFKGVLAKVAEAEAVPNPTPDDVFYTVNAKYGAAAALKDNALLEDTMKKMLATGRISPENTVIITRQLGAFALNRNDYAGAIGYFEQLTKLKPDDAGPWETLAEMYFSTGQKAKAFDAYGTAIAKETAAGRKPTEQWYVRRFQFAVDGKLTDKVVPGGVDLLKAYPSPANWRIAIVLVRDSLPDLDEQTDLDFLRLQAATDSLNGEKDYAEYADTALRRGFPGEAQFAINDGIAKKSLSLTKPYVKELQVAANSKVPADKASLPGLEKDSKASPKAALGTADAYYGYGDYAKAVTLYKMAVGKPGIDPAQANLRLGAALARSGDNVGAAESFKAVKGGPRETLAQFWLIKVGG
ncbi:MAG: hypothetical protein CFE37_08725 [Alphaproteobacteria bacterium PA4]|nr:MAG: hypothetical protein CFE37_08725 [Alphaproteobacteria bacterium PA4]